MHPGLTPNKRGSSASSGVRVARVWTRTLRAVLVWGTALALPLGLSTLGCGGEGDSDSSAEGRASASASASETSTATASASGSSTGTESGSDSAADDSETTGPVGDEYRPCPEGIADCPEGVLYACLTKITEGTVCSPQCEEHSDCPEPPPGGSATPVCTLVDDRKRCLLALCENDDDCPGEMTCHLETPNWCHWPYN